MDNLNEILEVFTERVVRLSKINIGKSKNPNGGKKIDSSGALRKSIKGDVTSDKVTISMLDYGVLRDAGQLGKKRKILKGWNKSIFTPRGKGFTSKRPPIQAIEKWIKDKPVRARSKGTGKFKKMDKTQLAGAISYSIWQNGIQPGLFMSDVFNDEFKKLPDEVIEAYWEDVEEQLKD